MSTATPEPRAPSGFFVELRKLPAFLRRDFLVAWSYRLSFLADIAGLALGIVMFYFVGKIVNPAVLPSYGGTQATYMEFVAVGIALGVFVSIGLGHVSAVIRDEQLQGTLESLLMTPTNTSTIQVGSVFYDLIYVPLRTAVFLTIVAVGFGLDYRASGLPLATVFLVLFIPFVWGLGVLSAALTLTFKQAAGIFSYVVSLLVLGSGAYFPLSVLPHWVETLSVVNPVAISLDGMRQALLTGKSWSSAGTDLLILTPISIVSLVLGLIGFRMAMQREKRRGSLGLY